MRRKTKVGSEVITKATLCQRAGRELKEFALLAAHLYVTLGAVILMKAAVLHDYGVDFTPWGIAAVKAILLQSLVFEGGIQK